MTQPPSTPPPSTPSTLNLPPLQDLKKKPKLREKYGVKDEWVLPFEVRRRYWEATTTGGGISPVYLDRWMRS